MELCLISDFISFSHNLIIIRGYFNSISEAGDNCGAGQGVTAALDFVTIDLQTAVLA